MVGMVPIDQIDYDTIVLVAQSAAIIPVLLLFVHLLVSLPLVLLVLLIPLLIVSVLCGDRRDWLTRVVDDCGL